MTRNSFRLALRHPTSWVFTGVVAAGLVMSLSRATPPPTGPELAALLGLSLAYLFVGTVVFLAVLQAGKPAWKIGYILIQIALGSLILVLGRGNGWLVMLPLASHSVALFTPRTAVFPCVLIAGIIAWNTSYFIEGWLSFFQSALVFGSAVLFAAVFTEISIRDTRRREEIELLIGQLERANGQLQAYAAQVEALSAAEERTRLAREIHDGLGHYLTAMAVQARVVETLLAQDPTRAGEALEKLQLMIQEGLADLRRAVAALRSEPLGGVGLRQALQGLLAECQAAGLAAQLTVYGRPYPLAPAQEQALYRAVQEGLTNVRKHAQASRADLQLEYWPEQVTLEIRDDGIGAELSIASLEDLTLSFGLFGLRERALLLGGSLEIETAPGAGFCLEMRLPVMGKSAPGSGEVGQDSALGEKSKEAVA